VVSAAPPPSRDQVREKLHELIVGQVSREEVADWASAWVREPEPTVDDAKVWESLKRLAGADLRVSPVDYLHIESDFHLWLDELEDSE
jgi:hypothetical protein